MGAAIVSYTVTSMTGSLKSTSPIETLVRSPGVRDLLQWFSRERLWINEQHLQVCRIPAPTFLEQKRAEWMVAQFKALGWEARIDRAGNVIAQLQSKPPVASFVALTAHLDTVLAPRVPEDISVAPDGRLTGPGVADNGAGLAALLAIARALRSAPGLIPPPVNLLLIANVGEEGEGNLSGMRFLCKQSPLARQIRAFLVLDGPALDHITCQALASRRFEVVFSGPGGHSWSDFGVGNPVHALARAIALFTENAAESWPGMSPRTSYNFGVIDGGSSINSIATSARAKVDIRSESGERIAQLAEVLSACVERSQQVENERSPAGRVSARIREIGSRPGGELAPDAPILSYVRAVDAPSRDPVAARLRLYRRQYSAVNERAGNFHRRGRSGGRRPYGGRVVPSGGARDRAEARSIDVAAAAARRGMKRADIALALIALIWGATFVLVKAALGHVSALLFLTVRFSIAALALYLLFRIKGTPRRKVSGRHWVAGMLTGCFLFGGYVLQTLGLRYTTRGNRGSLRASMWCWFPFSPHCCTGSGPIPPNWRVSPWQWEEWL
jgi:Acetylornithine deacetylase/Succinyl-diaminopimelate desuccinylase and related deacylases